MTNLLNKLKKNTNRIIHNQVMNAPDFEASAAHVTGGRKDTRKLANALNIKRIKFRIREMDCE